jgi:DNA repair exonuclease SbcCD ATPase subunit
VSPRDNGPGYWRALAFGDLHVNQRTLARALETLRRIRLVVTKFPAIVVCLGDFWDKRGVLAVRQIDAVLRELDEWQRAGIRAVFLPGNHDQVSLDGTIHGIKIFEPFPNITVATERLIFPQDRLAFVPWREDAQDQGELFATLEPPGNWTIFGHAEVRGAIANNGHTSPGRVTLGQIQASARACYLGHYHKRQQLGDRTWYIGSPFEMNAGERNMPHGLAIIESTSITPTFVDLDDFPKHHQIDLRTSAQLPAIRTHDIVEVIATKEQLTSPSMKEWIQALPTRDVRPHPVRADLGDAPPPIAWTLIDAVREYVRQESPHPSNEPLADIDHALVSAGEELLRTVAPAAGDTEPLGTTARILSVSGHDFCALRGHFTFNLDRQGAILLRGPIGSGKTSLADSITWVLYDVTSPRRAAGDAPNLRGDDVIHDDVDSMAATVLVEVDGDRYAITRSKKRGKGSKLKIQSDATRPAGISDDNEWIVHIVGLSYGLWRACVSLGQGAVASFLTGSDKARKALLSDAHGLSVCDDAQKEARRRLKDATETTQGLERRKHAATSVLEHIESQDFSAEAATWERERREALERLKRTVAETEKQIVVAAQALQELASTQESYDTLEDQAIKLERALARTTGSDAQRARLQRDLGALQAERSMAERDLGALEVELSRLVQSAQGGDTGPCPTCQQPMPRAHLDRHIAQHEEKMRAKRIDIQTFDTRMSQLAMQLEGLTGVDTGEREKLHAELTETRSKMSKVSEALRQFERIRANKDALEQRREAAIQEGAEVTQRENPWMRKAQETAEQAEAKRAELEELADELGDLHESTETLRFWADGFGQKGLPVVVLRSILGDLEQTANDFLVRLVEGRIWAELSLADDALDIKFRKYDPDAMIWRERRLEQLSTGERRCAELAFSPFGLSEMLFRRLKCKVPFLVIDELTTHLGAAEKSLACDVLQGLERETVLVIDHDQSVQGEFDVVYDLVPTSKGVDFMRTR